MQNISNILEAFSENAQSMQSYDFLAGVSLLRTNRARDLRCLQRSHM